ncbi:putative Secreted Protein (CpLSP gene family) [Cryptosporidium meleagridis]
MFEKSSFNLIISLILLYLKSQISYSEETGRNYEEGSNLISCFDPPFDGLEIPGRGILMVHKGHRLIPQIIPSDSEFCDSPRNLFEVENDIWDNNVLVPKDYEEFSQLVNEAKDVAEKDEQIISALNDLLMTSDGAKTNQKTDNIGMHVVNEPTIIPEHVFPLHGNSHPHAHTELIDKNDEEISDFEDSSLLDDLNISKNDDGGIKMRMFMFKEFSMDYLARKGLPLNINEEAMYSPENFEFFNSNWPSREKELIVEVLPNSIWRVFLASGILTSHTTTNMSEEMKKMLVLESLNAFFNGLERYYLQNMDSELDSKYYSYLNGLGVENALDTMKYYRESIKFQQDSKRDNSIMSENNDKEHTKSQELTSNDLSDSSINSSSLEVPDSFEESSIPRSVSETNKKQYENSVVTIDNSQNLEIFSKSAKGEKSQAIEIDSNSQLETFVKLRIKWFNIFVNDYLGRLGIKFSILEEYCNDPSIIEFFKVEIPISEGLPEIILEIFMGSGFGSQFSDYTTEDEKINIVYDIWVIFNQMEKEIFSGQTIANGYLLKKDLFDVEIRETMRQYWDGNLDDTANKLIHLSKQRTISEEKSEIESIFEDELIRNRERAKEMGIFKGEKSQSNGETSKSSKEISEIYNTGSETENSKAGDSYKKSELEEKSIVGKKKGKNKKRKSKQKKSNEGKEKRSGILNKAKEFLESFKKEPEIHAREESKTKSSKSDISSSKSTLDDVEKSSDSPLNMLNFGSSIKDEEENSEFSERFGIDTLFEKSFENLNEPKYLEKEPSLSSLKQNKFEEKLNNLENNEVRPEKSEVSTSLKEEVKEKERMDLSEQPPKKEPSVDVSPETKVMVNLFEDIPLADESFNSEDSFRLNGDEDIIKKNDQISQDTNEKSMTKIDNGLGSQYEKTSQENEDFENYSVPSYQEENKFHYEPTEEISKTEPSNSSKYLPKEDDDLSGEETKEHSEEGVTPVSDKEKPIKKKFSKLFENKLSTLFANTKKFFGFDKKSSKENLASSDHIKEDQDQYLNVEEEYENLTKMIIYFIQSYAALRYKFADKTVIENSFDEINDIVKSSIHFHQGTTEFDNVDMEKAIKKIAAMLGGGSFTALKSIGLTTKDITANLKRYLIKLFPTETTLEHYKKDKKLNTTNFWLKQHFTQDVIKDGMIPEQLERPLIAETSQDLIAKSNDQRFIEAKAENLCKRIPSILEKFFDTSMTKKITHTDYDCIAVVAANELYGLSLSNSLFLFLFNYKTNYWRFLTPDISFSISQILENE